MYACKYIKHINQFSNTQVVINSKHAPNGNMYTGSLKGKKPTKPIQRRFNFTGDALTPPGLKIAKRKESSIQSRGLPWIRGWE